MCNPLPIEELKIDETGYSLNCGNEWLRQKIKYIEYDKKITIFQAEKVGLMIKIQKKYNIQSFIEKNKTYPKFLKKCLTHSCCYDKIISVAHEKHIFERKVLEIFKENEISS